jgi:tetratricopeptide (TPR) repeat protein
VADIFISYTSSDRDWAFWIAKELEALGHVPHVHEWEIKGGDDIYAWMEQRHDAADHVLCVVSDEYLEAPYSTLERNAAIWQAAAKRPGFVLFVAVKPCSFPTLIDHYRRCQLYGVADDEARQRFRAFMQEPAGAAPIAFPGEAFAVSNVPIRVPEHFLGREDSLEAVAAALGRYEGRVAITALHGLRGAGKTTLAAAYAERHRGDYRATWWIRAQNESTMRADLVGLGVRLKWVAADEQEEPAFAAVMDRLRLEGAGILLIYDNALDADALRSYLPRGGAARVLVTSNAHTWRGVAQPVEIRFWPKEVGADYLIARTGRSDERAAAEVLSKALGGLPLAHEQAAAYCERLDVSLPDYHARFDAAPAKFLDDTRHAPADYHDGLTVAKTFALAIEKAAKLHPGAESLIVHAALLAPEPIPLYFFSEGREKLGEPLASSLADDGLDEAVAALRTFALVDRESIPDERDPATTTECIRLHRLVRELAAPQPDGPTREAMWRGLIEAALAVYPPGVWEDPETWPRARRLDALVVGLVDGDIVATDGDATATLLACAGIYRLSVLAAYAQARPLFERALAMRERVFGSEHSAVASSLNQLATLLQYDGDLAAARLLFERALAIYEKADGPEDFSTAACLGNLGLLLQRQEDLAAARPLFERALAISEKVLGPEHLRTALSLDNLAGLLQEEGDLAAARPLNERALAIREKVLGPEHFETARSFNNLALLLQRQGDFAAAQPLFERVLAMTEKQLGPEHPETAMVLANLAFLVLQQRDGAAARRLFERALAIREKVLGPEHAVTAESLHHLGMLLLREGDLPAARPLLERVLAIEKVLGRENLHIDTSHLRHNLAMSLLSSGSADQALTLGEAALEARDKALGREHKQTKDSARVTAVALDALGRANEAKALRARYGIEATTQ